MVHERTEAEVNFKDGKPDGLVVEWSTGEKMSEVTYKDFRWFRKVF